MKKMMIFAVMMSIMLMPAQMMAQNNKKNEKPKMEFENRKDDKKNDKFDNRKDDKKNDKFDNRKDDKKNDKFDNKKNDKKNDFNRKPKKPQPPIAKKPNPKPKPKPKPKFKINVVDNNPINEIASVIGLAALIAIVAN